MPSDPPHELDGHADDGEAPVPPDSSVRADDRPFDEEVSSEGTHTLALDDDAIEMLDDGEVLDEPTLDPPARISTRPPPAPTDGTVVDAAPPAPTETTDDVETLDVAPEPEPGAPEPAPPAPRAAGAVAPAPAASSGPSVAEQAVAEAQSDDWARRAAELRAELEAEADKPRIALFAYELGELLERRLRDEPTAVKSYARALQADPSLRPNLWAIRRVFYRRALWPNLLKLVDAEIRFARDSAESADLLVEKARILEDRTKDRAGAKAAYDRAIALVPTCIPALLGRERLALQDRETDALAKLWRTLAEASTSPARKVGYLLDLAHAEANEPDGGAERALATILEAVALGADRDRVARERERLAERAGDDDALLAALEARVALCAEKFGPAGPTPPQPGDETTTRERHLRHEIVALRRRQARVARDANDPARAWSYLELAAGVAPDEPLLLYDLADLAEETGRHEELAAALAHLVALESDPTRALALELRRADALTRAGKTEEADAVLDAVVATAPGYLAVTDLRARRALEAGDWERIAALYTAEAAAARLGTPFGPESATHSDPRWAAAAYVAAGDLYDVRLDRADDARAAYAQALEVVAGYRPAVEALCALHERHARWEDAAALIDSQLRGAPDGSSAPGGDDGSQTLYLLARLAALHEQRGDREGALGALRRLAERLPDDLTLRFHIDELLAETGRSAERAELLARVAPRVEDPARRAALYLELARVLEEDLDRPAEAAEAYGQALALAPGDRASRAARGALLRRAGRWEELVAERKAEAAEEGAGAARALREAGAILARKLGRPAEAAEIYRELCDRVPDDAAAFRALAAALGEETDASLEVREREVALLGGAAAAEELVRLGELYERLGRDEDAAASFRRAREEVSAAAHAGWALASLTARAGDTRGLAEALGGLADTVRAAAEPDPIADDLAEESAWIESDDGATAAERFEAIVARAPDRRSAHLGRSLVAARRRDAAGLAAALTAQAERTTDPGAAAALLLRAATLTEVTEAADGASDSRFGAAILAGRALTLHPEDPGALLATAERPAVPGADADARTDVLMRRAALAEDPETRASLDLELAVELERAGLLAHCGLVLAGVLRSDGNNLPALLLLRRVARRAGDRETLARVSLRLGRVLQDPGSSSEALTEAATILDEHGQLDRAASVWREVLDRVPEHDRAFERAHKFLAASDDAAALHELLSHRLRHTLEPADEIPYRLQRATIRKRLGDVAGAAADLRRVLEVDERELEALSALAEVELAVGRPTEASLLLERFLEVCEDPVRRAPVELRLSGVLCETLGDLDGAIRHLDQALQTAPDDLAARERLVDVLLRKGDTERAAHELEQLSSGRTEPDLRARDELRAAQLFRTKLQDDTRARRALERARRLDPLNLDVVRELVEASQGGAAEAALASAVSDARAALAAAPADPASYERLCKLGDLANDADLVYFGASALLALGSGSTRRAAYQKRRQAVAAEPPRPARQLSEDQWRSRLEHPGARGPLSDLWQCLAESAARLDEHDPGQLGFAKSERIAPKLLAKQAPLVDTLARAVGLGEIDVYVSPKKPGFARAVPLETPALFLGEDVARGETLELRFLLARALSETKRRSAPLEEMPHANLLLLLSAAVKLAGGDPGKYPVLSGGLHAAGHLDERVKVLGKVISRRDRKALPLALDRLGQAEDLGEWVDAMRATCRRAALLLTGDLSGGLPPGERRRNLASDKLALDLLAWGVGEDHLTLRKELGL